MKQHALWLSLLLLFAFDRLPWPSIASWREDEAAVMWVARHFSPLEWTVGLISSRGLPNPNGVLWIGRVLSYAPDLFWSGVFLQLVNLGVLFAICRRFAAIHAPSAGLWLFILLGSLFTYRSSGSEPFCQWLMLPINLISVVAFLGCLQAPSFSRFFFVLSFLWVPPGLYIAGLLNSVTLSLALAICLTRQSFRRGLLASRFFVPFGLFVAWSALALLFVWRPYFSTIAMSDLKMVSSVAPTARLKLAALELPRLPIWLWNSAVDPDFSPSIYADQRIIEWPLFSRIGVGARWVFRALLLLALLAAMRPKAWKIPEFRRSFLWPLALLAIAFVCSPLLGGPAFTRGERPDIGLQWTLLVFMSIAALNAAAPPRPLRVAFLCAAITFVGLELGAGWIAVSRYYHYAGNQLTGADVPVHQKMAVIDEIVREARERHIGPDIPIRYDVGGRNWRWIQRANWPAFRHYGASYTLGRAFDYDLDRRYGIKNAFEGTQNRRSPWGFLVNYRYEHPIYRHGNTSQKEIGRLRVTYRQRPS